MDLYTKTKIKNLNKLIEEMDSELNSLPDGELIVYKNNGSYRWYYLTGNSKIYLSKKNKQLAEKLAYKKYILLKKQALLEQKAVIEFNSTKVFQAQKAMQDFLKFPGNIELLSKTHIRSDFEWPTKDFKTNTLYPEQKCIPCPSGNYVRSKSEGLIDMVLTEHAIPFRYECELIIGTQTFYPDFTLINPTNGKIIYWEHLGLMDNPNYAKNVFSKIRTYYNNGIIPGKNLIITYETSENPFSYVQAEAALTIMNL